MKALSQFMMGLAWASSWPITLQSARENDPTFILLGAGFALLPETLDQWIAPCLHKPDVHIVFPPESPDPYLLAGTLARIMCQAQHSGDSIDIACYPIPTGQEQWMPYTLLFDSTHRKISVTIAGTPPVSASTTLPIDFTTDHTACLEVHSHPLSLRARPVKHGRLTIQVRPSRQQWSHSLILAAASGTVATGLWGLSAGLIAAGAYALPVLLHQCGFRGGALFWPFKQERCHGLQWVKPNQHSKIDLAVLWLAFLLLAGNLIHSTTPSLYAPSRFQLLLTGGAIALALMTLFRLNKRVGQNQADGRQEHE